MDPATVTIERKTEALAALEAVLDAYPDLFAPSCWHEGPDYCEGPCSAVPVTATRTAWVIALEWMDLDPAGKCSSVFVTSSACGQARAAGLMSQGQRLNHG